jgi:transposase
MARDFRRPQRDQQFLLPPDMREWLGPNHLVWFVIDAVEALELSAWQAKSKTGGVGRAPLDPGMLLTLLIYAYAHGERSSRQIERLCGTDVAFRVICGNDTPDHSTIARFRATHESSFADVFTQVLVLCAQAGLGRFGSVAIDGTKIAGNASAGANRSEETLRAEAARIVEEAGQVDAAEDAELGEARGDELPEQWANPTSRVARIRECLDQIAKDKQEDAAGLEVRVGKWQENVDRAEAKVAAVRAKVTPRWEAAQRGEKLPGGPRPVPPDEHILVRRAQDYADNAKARLARAIDQGIRPYELRKRSQMGNVTDPDTRLMPTRNGWVQGFNAQVAVTDDQLILATCVNNNPVDAPTFIPMMTAAVQTAAMLAQVTGRTDTNIGVVLADAGYISDANLTADGPDRLIALGKHRVIEKAARQRPTTGAPPDALDPVAAMDHRLRTQDGITAYRRRGATVEPTIGSLKDRTGLRRFTRRGLTAAASEIHLAATVHNLLKWRQATLAY